MGTSIYSDDENSVTEGDQKSPTGTPKAIPPLLAGIQDDSGKVGLLVEHYEKQLRTLKDTISKLRTELQDRGTYISRIEVELVEKKVELVNMVDRYHEMEQQNIA